MFCVLSQWLSSCDIKYMCFLLSYWITKHYWKQNIYFFCSYLIVFRCAWYIRKIDLLFDCCCNGKWYRTLRDYFNVFFKQSIFYTLSPEIIIEICSKHIICCNVSCEKSFAVLFFIPWNSKLKSMENVLEIKTI